jgi:TatD DNase family protein
VYDSERLPEIAAMALIDTHAHLDDDRFAGDLPEVLARAASVGIERIIAVATTLQSSRRCLELAALHSMVSSSAGIHPNHVTEATSTDWDQTARLATLPEAVALGETGLDRHWNYTPFALQEDYFARHLELSRRLKKPVIIHSRDCDRDMERLLRAEFDRHGPILGVMHSFTGSAALAGACLEMGLYISFAGMITYKNAQNLRDIAATVPADRILVETDCPYLPPVPHRGKRNEPAHVAETAQCIALARSQTFAEFSDQTTANARRLFAT